MFAFSEAAQLCVRADGGEALSVKIVEPVFDGKTRTEAATSEFGFGACADFVVVLQKIGALADALLDQAVTDEYLGRLIGIDAGQADITLADLQAEQHLALFTQSGCRLGAPKGFGVLELEQVASHVLDPLHLHLGGGAGKQPTSLHPLAANDPCGRSGFGWLRFTGFCVGGFALFLGRGVIEQPRTREE